MGKKDILDTLEADFEVNFSDKEGYSIRRRNEGNRPGGKPPGKSGSSLLIGVVILGLVVLVAVAVFLLAGALALSGGTAPDLAVEPVTSTTEVSTTVAPTSTTLTTTSTTAAPIDTVQESRDRIASIVAEPPRSDLNRRDVDKVMRDIDEAIVSASEGNAEKAMDQLEKIAEEFDEKLDDDHRDAALAELERLAASLGLTVVSEDHDD